jgi:hypothetical protein
MLDISVRKVQYKLHDYGMVVPRAAANQPPTTK